MIFKVLMIGVLVTMCFGQKELKEHDEEVVKEIKIVPIPYNFEYNTEDVNGTSQFRKESSDGNGKVQGRYGYKDAFGVERIVEYVADENGYRAQIKTNEPGTESMSPAAVQFSAQPMQISYQTPREAQKQQEQRESTESTVTLLHAEDTESKVDESTLSNLEYSTIPNQEYSTIQNQEYSTIASTLPPIYQPYTFYGQDQPKVLIHHSFGQPPVAIPVHEATSSEYRPISLNFNSPVQQPFVNQKFPEPQYPNQKSLEQQYANQKSQQSQFPNQKRQEQQNVNHKSQEQQYTTQKSQEQQYNQKSSEQQYVNQKSQQRHNEIQKPQEQYGNYKSQEQQYNNPKSQDHQYDNLRSQEQIVHLYTPNIQYIGQNIPPSDILIPAKQYYQQPPPQNLHTTAHKREYSLRPVPSSYSQDSDSPLVHQFISLQNQAVVRPKIVGSNTPVEYAHFPVYAQEYSSQEKQLPAQPVQMA